jgi:hypothetical protein
MNNLKTLALASIIASASLSTFATVSLNDTEIVPVENMSVLEWAYELGNTSEMVYVKDTYNQFETDMSEFNAESAVKLRVFIDGAIYSVSDAVTSGYTFLENNTIEGYNYVSAKLK